MITDQTLEADSSNSSQADLSKRVRGMTLAVAAVALLVGAAMTAFSPRYGLFAAACILGWTRLVGL
jgi:hypothetical protein